jgi:protein-disulfide isomerase
MSLRKTLLVLSVLLIAVGVSACGSKDSSTSSSTATSTAGAETVPGADKVRAEFAGIPQRGEVLGDPKAPWTLVEYGDLQCPACKFYSETTMPDVVSQLVKPGKIQFAMRPFGFVGPDSVPAANYAWAASKQNKLHDFTSLWYLNQGEENSGYVTDAFARRIASGVDGLNADQLIRDAKGVPVRALSQRTADEFAAKKLNGTPSFLIGKTGGPLREIDLGDGTGAAAVAAIQAAIGS